jgi:hypothetical protein
MFGPLLAVIRILEQVNEPTRWVGGGTGHDRDNANG